MIVCSSKKFVIGHIPKTAGHALAIMLIKKGLEIDHPFEIIADKSRAISTSKYKHENIDEFIKNVDDLRGWRFCLVCRRLPDWMFAVFWHQLVHTRYNSKSRLTKIGIGEAYSFKLKNKVPQIPPPEIFSHCSYADFILKKHLPTLIPSEQVHWFRMEALRDDIRHLLKITLPATDLIHSYTKAKFNELNVPLAYHDYWNEETLQYLYENNPMWAKLETQLYGRTLNHLDLQSVKT